ncbi:hypothetical protein BCR39DRAFT_591218 [Naematelia encephala]|uniref:Arrestin C-terminal-like domain-containing protein n=1 Tax=Naematelia encephala TaxID=71784 RepID=A0A1Y2AJL3_9TREE|nr:hypothetical protein BCR39DRAFT_591218 [Naematelia encephala]
MPHTISPSPSSQGLGISLSTLSPPPASTNNPQQRFTGIGVGPGPRPRLPQPPSPARGPMTNTLGAPLSQPPISLRPTHTRSSSSKGFTSFSALPPSPAVTPERRRLPSIPSQSFSKPSNPGQSHDTIPTERAAPATERPVPATERAPSRSGSVASTATSSSRIKRSRSSDLLRRLSKNQTVSGGRYVALGDEDEHEEPSSTNPQASPSRPRSGTASSSAHTVSSSEAYNLNANPFPIPPNHPPRTSTALSDPTNERPSVFQARGMPRSFSQPLHLHAVPEIDDFSSLYRDTTKRRSDPSTGIHSRNAVLLSAESGGTMLAFSPSGDGVWRQGEVICGAQTGLIPNSQTTPSAPRSQHRRQTSSDNVLNPRPWNDSNMPQQIPQRRPGSLGQRVRSLSDGVAILNRQGTLFHPSSSHERASAELSLMLGGPKSRRLSGNKLLTPPELDGWQAAGGDSADKIRLEAAKKRKARVEVDVVLERECVVEGGEIRGRMEVRVTGGKRGEGLRVGGGKVRVIGFEDISAKSRHIFYHYPQSLPVFQVPPTSSQPLPHCSLFASDPDSDGYRLAAEGVHSIPFRMRLPLGGGAKGSFTSANGKGPCVRYVVVGSIKIHVPTSGKRSIAHFYRPVVVLPYLNPAVTLSPSQEPIEARIEKGLGWSLTGEKGIVQVAVALGRRNWVAGQRAWCEVAIKNDSTRKIKTLNLALLQTVQVFTPDPNLMTGGASTPDLDACQTSTQRRKVSEEVIEADFADRGAGRVTGKGWWTGVDAGESGHWDLSLLIPNGLLSIRRTRLIEVMYTLRVTLNGSIYVDLPITLINFLSIDPPPMPGDGIRAPPISGQLAVSIPNQVYDRPGMTRLASERTLDSSKGPARASSTTLHIDALLSAGRARANANGGTDEPPEAKSRPLSMGSQYTVDQQNNSYSSSGHHRTQSVPEIPASTTTRPTHTRTQSYLSDNQSSNSGDDLDDESDKALVAMRRAQGRQRSLAAILRAKDREAQALAEEDEILSPGVENEPGEWKPLRTPEEAEAYAMIADTPSVGGATTGRVGSMEHMNGVEAEDTRTRQSAEEDGWEETQTEHGGTWETVGNDTILDELVSSQGHDHEDVDGGLEQQDDTDDYDHQSHLGVPQEQNHRLSLPRELPAIDVDPRLFIDARHLSPEVEQTGTIPEELEQTTGETSQDLRQATDTASDDLGQMTDFEPSSLHGRPRFGSFAPSAVSAASEGESEVGQVYQAIKRDVSIKVPSSKVAALHERRNQSPVQNVNTETSPNKVLLSHLHPHVQRSGSAPGPPFMSVGVSGRRSSTTADLRRESAPMARHGSAPTINSTARRDSTPTIPSPLRPVEEAPAARVIQKKSSFSFASPVSPLRVKAQLPTSSKLSPKSPGLSPRSLHQPGMLNPAEPLALAMGRQLSGTSSLRNEVPINISPEPSDEDEAPGLAPSVASDSASSDGHALDSPPFTTRSPPRSHPMPRLPSKDDAMKYQHIDPFATSPPEITHHWQPPTTQVNMAQIFTNTNDYNSHGHSLPRLPPPARSVDSHDSRRSSHSSTNSILPSVRNKIAQLESRDEALRKFSVASAASMTTPVSPQRKRQSYTAALAPRHPVRSASDDLDERDRVGGTTFVRPKVYASQDRMSYYGGNGGNGSGNGLVTRSPTQGRLERNLSTSSASTTATAIEQALMSRTTSPRVIGGPRLPRVLSGRSGWEEGDADGTEGMYEPEYEQGSVSSNFRGGPGDYGGSARIRGSIAEWSEESEGLL